MDRKKKKLEAGLGNLFSTAASKKTEETSTPLRGATKDENVEQDAILPYASSLFSEEKRVEPQTPVSDVEDFITEHVESAPLVVEQPVESSHQPRDRSTGAGQAQSSASSARIATNGREEQLVVFTLAGEQYGVDIGAVESIIKLQSITTLPQAPAFIKGITNLRGVVLPVVDLRKRFGLPVGEATKETRIVVAETDGAQVGMIVDAVTEVLRVPEEAIEPPSPVVTAVDGDWSSRNAFITGIAKVDERLIILLDLGKALSPGDDTLQQAQDGD